MSKHKNLKDFTILAFILFVGLGLALTLPWIESTNIYAAQNETASQADAPGATIYYVSKDGDNSAPTEGFDTGYKYMWDAIAYAGLSGGGEIWVAAGVYYPDEGESVPDNDPSQTFYLADTIGLYGCFDTDDKKFSDRDCDRNVTVLSGDIDKNDIKDSNGVVTNPDSIRGDNAYHVVTAPAGTINGELDGFTITAGQADGRLYFEQFGGGFFCSGSVEDKECNPYLKDIIFSGNTAINGGAMFNDGSNKGNGSPSLINVTFTGNSAEENGGAVYNYGPGGESSPSLKNVVFSGNSAGSEGGAVYNRGDLTGISSPILINVTFSGNYAGTIGGAMCNYGSGGTSSPDIRNSIFWNNQDNSGPGTLGANIYNDGADATLGHSLLQGSGGSSSWTDDPDYVDDRGNIDADPVFRLDIDPSSAPTTAGNLRLQAGSPAIDEGKNDFISGILTDVDGAPRKVDGNMDSTITVDMGAYERQNYTYLPAVTR